MKRMAVLMCVCFSTRVMSADTGNKQYVDYIHMYNQLAIEKIKKHHIPASIPWYKVC